MSSATLPLTSLNLHHLAIPTPSRAKLLRSAAYAAGSAAFAVALWTLLAAIMILG